MRGVLEVFFSPSHTDSVNAEYRKNFINRTGVRYFNTLYVLYI